MKSFMWLEKSNQSAFNTEMYLRDMLQIKATHLMKFLIWNLCRKKNKNAETELAQNYFKKAREIDPFLLGWNHVW